MSTTSTAVGATLRRFLGGLIKGLGTDDIELDTEDAAGTITSKKTHIGDYGFEAKADRPSDARRVAYPSAAPLELTYSLSPKSGWTFQNVAGIDAIFSLGRVVIGSNIHAVAIQRHTNGGAYAFDVGGVAACPFPEPKHNSEVYAATTKWVYRVTSLVTVWTSASSGDTLQFVRYSRATPQVREVIYSVTSSGGGTKTDSTPGSAGWEYLDYSQYTYHAEWLSETLAEGAFASSGLFEVDIVVEKRAVE